MRLISLISAFASIIGLMISVLSIPQLTMFQMLLIVVFIISTIFSIIFEYNQYKKSKPKIYKSKREIRDYMYNWIKTQGRVAIFTRDMSWVDDDDMKALLFKKAEKNDLIVCLPMNNNISEQLKEKGASIYTYENLGITPKSRFTIINYDKADTKVAVGKTIGPSNHVIEEYSNGIHPFCNVANDLVNVIKQYNQCN